MNFLFIIAMVLLIESITNILVKSELFLPVRKVLFESRYKIFKFLGRILDCPYCTSVWVSLFCVAMGYLYFINFLPQIMAFFFVGLILHRLSNILHHVIDRIDSHFKGGQGN